MDLTDHERFVALFVRHQAAIHSFILTMLPSVVDSEEVLQESSMTMWKKFDQFEPNTNFRNWAFQIARYTTFNYVRRLGRDRHLFNESMMKQIADYAEEQNEELENRRRVLRQCIAKLEPRDTEVLSNCYSEDSTIAAYAERVNKTANAVTKQLGRIRRSLLKCVRRTLGLEGFAQ
ncbi:MAG: sigma-70 family RNA polymerase sigma factor [Planctomycetota bacterium]